MTFPILHGLCETGDGASELPLRVRCMPTWESNVSPHQMVSGIIRSLPRGLKSILHKPPCISAAAFVRREDASVVSQLLGMSKRDQKNLVLSFIE